MTFSLKSLILTTGWFCVLFTLVYQIHIEAMRPQWTSQVPSGIILMVNSLLSLLGLLTAIATDAQKRPYWIGFAIVACSLTLLQLLDIKPAGIGLNGAYLLEPLVMPGEDVGRARIFRSGHLVQLENVLIYGPIPLLAALGGWYTQLIADRRD